MLNELENTVLKLTGRHMQNNQKHAPEPMPPKEVTSTTATPSVLKTAEDIKVLKKLVKSQIEESMDDIIEETEGE